MSLGVLNNLPAMFAENNLNKHKQQPVEDAATVVFRIADQLRRR